MSEQHQRQLIATKEQKRKKLKARKAMKAEAKKNSNKDEYNDALDHYNENFKEYAIDELIEPYIENLTEVIVEESSDDHKDTLDKVLSEENVKFVCSEIRKHFINRDRSTPEKLNSMNSALYDIIVSVLQDSSLDFDIVSKYPMIIDSLEKQLVQVLLSMKDQFLENLEEQVQN